MSSNDPHAHESPIKTPQQLIVVAVLAFAVPVLVIVMLTQLVTGGPRIDEAAMAPEAVAIRIKPVADVAIEEGRTAAKGSKSGEAVVQSACAACHQTGAAGAPKIGDKAAWAKLIAKGQKALVADSMKGVRAMPPRGGASELTDIEFERAVVYMANKSGGSFSEPASPRASAKASK